MEFIPLESWWLSLVKICRFSNKPHADRYDAMCFWIKLTDRLVGM